MSGVSDGSGGLRSVHHIDLWVSALSRGRESWGWLLGELGWSEEFSDDDGCAWTHPDGTYVFMQTALVHAEYVRTGIGMNHLALLVDGRDRLDALRAAAPEHGWSELFAEKYPHAGGEQHVALYLEDRDGLEVEVVTPPATAEPVE